MDERIEAPAAVDPSDNYNQIHRRLPMPPAVASSSEAAYPGGITVDVWRWAWSFPGEVAVVVLPTIALGLAFYFFLDHRAVFISLALLFRLARPKLQRLKVLRRHFLYGCTNPAVVLSTSPPLVAVYTDLSVSDGADYPYVKVIRQPLSRIAGGLPAVGTRLATVALYKRPIVNGHWSSFDPISAGLVTDAETAAAAIYNLPGYNWNLLTEAVDALPAEARTRPGLYPVPQRMK